MSNKKLSKSANKHKENHYTIFETYRCLDKTENRFMALPHSIINHKSFTTMKTTSKLIYFYMTDFSVGKQDFTFPRSIYKNICCNETFKNSIYELIEHGFIQLKQQGGLYNNKAIYEFTSKWKGYVPKAKEKKKTKIQENKRKALNNNN